MRHPSRALLMASMAVAVAAIGIAPRARADWGMPNMYLSQVWFAESPGETATLLVVPDGSGPPLSQALRQNGALIDRVLHLQAFDDVGAPLAQLETDGWTLAWQDGGVHACGGGLPPDRATGPDGLTEWARPLRAGGQSRALLRVTWFGMRLWTNEGLVLQVNSPDLNGDLVVDLVDVTLFAQDFHADDYRFRSDLRADGDVNLADIIPMAKHLGARCP